jgi:TRAP-type transport system periplasmic protein
MKSIKVFMVFTFLVIWSVWIAPTRVSAQDKIITLRYSIMWPPGHQSSVLSEQWCKEVEKRTNGRVKVQQFAGATLTSPQGTYDSVVKGVVDIGLCVLGYTMGKFPLTDVVSYPLGCPSAHLGSKLVNEYYAKFKPAEFNEVKPLYFLAGGPAVIHTKKPVYKMEDLKGMKIRTFGPTSAFISAMGGVPVAMPMSDAYDAISRGVVDGIYVAYEALEGFRLAEVVRYTTENYGSAYSGVQMIAMNKQKWNSLPNDIQKIIETINQEWIETHGKMWDTIDKSGKDYSLKRGNKVITLSPEEDRRWATKAQPVIDDYIKKMKEKNLPGEEVVKFYREKLRAK